MTICFVCGRDVPLENQQLYRHLQEHNRTGLSLADVLGQHPAGDDDEWRAWDKADHAEAEADSRVDEQLEKEAFDDK